MANTIIKRLKGGIVIFVHVVGQGNYGIISDGISRKWGDEKHVESAKAACRKKFSKRVKCLQDNHIFVSMTEASKYYGISTCSVSISVRENKAVLCKKDNKMRQFVLV